jgi:predicted RNA binding protein YcfA (HicA-like mRNA interferase family)
MAKCAELLRLLLRAGWEIEKQQGSHIKLGYPGKKNKLSFPNHGSAEMKTGTMRAIFKHAGMLHLIEKKKKKRKS